MGQTGQKAATTPGSESGHRSLTFLTWNLAMFERPFRAPTLWDPTNTEGIVRTQVLDLEPDVVLYQELPGMVPFVESHTMLRANPRSHSGYLATLITHELADPEPAVTVVDRCAVLTTFTEPELTIANVHLAPGKAAAADRMMQIAAIIKASPTPALLIVGDTNTRMEEVDQLVEMGFSSTKPPKVTWDSRKNRFRRDMAQFSAYFTRWFASPGVEVEDVVVHDDPVELEDHSFYVSDHFALSGRVSVTNVL